MFSNYVQINIGRNVDGMPMSRKAWASFIDESAAALVYAATIDNAERRSMLRDDVVEIHTGTGSYGGIREDSAHVSMFHSDGIDADDVRAVMADVAARYGQDAVALIVGSELVKGAALFDGTERTGL